MKILSSLILFLALSLPAWATTWYVRDGGGSVYGTSNAANTCNGQTNVVYSLGASPNCALNHPRLVLGYNIDTPQPQHIAGGDTLNIDGDSDTSPGNQAQYLIGYDDVNGTTPSCSTSFPYDCIMDNIPAGSSGTPTQIIGTGTHQPQLWGNERAWEVLDAENNYITIQNLEITDHEACAYNDPTGGCQYSGSYPYGAWGEDGIEIGNATGLVLNNDYIHGLGRYGLNVEDGTTSTGNITMTGTWIIGNGFGGFTTGINNVMTGTVTMNQPIVEWNGCVEAYPVTGGIDNPSNYTNCFGQKSNGYGDGVAFGNDGNGNAGNWTLIGPGSISFNTQDGLDTLHGDASGTIQVDKMRFEGNAGDQLKLNGLNTYVTNSVIFGDCGWWYGAPQSLSGGMQPGDSCRALGDTFLFATPNSSNISILNNTFVGNGNIVLEQDGTCNSTPTLIIKNNIIQGGYGWADDTTWNGSGGNTLTTYTYVAGTDGDGTGCTGLVWNEDYNIVTNTKGSNSGCNGAHDKCGVSPGFTGTVPVGTAGGGASTYYQGQAGLTLIPITTSSAAKVAGVNGLSYWNNENDYYNVVRGNPPSMGAQEFASCAATSYGCQFNSDCCSGTCTANACTGSAPPLTSYSVSSGGATVKLFGNVSI